jgi:hypothetical protein
LSIVELIECFDSSYNYPYSLPLIHATTQNQPSNPSQSTLPYHIISYQQKTNHIAWPILKLRPRKPLTGEIPSANRHALSNYIAMLSENPLRKAPSGICRLSRVSNTQISSPGNIPDYSVSASAVATVGAAVALASTSCLASILALMLCIAAARLQKGAPQLFGGTPSLEAVTVIARALRRARKGEVKCIFVVV